MLAAGTGARAADAPKPLRTIVYNVLYSAKVQRNEQTSGFGATSGHGMIERIINNDDHGTLTVNVVAATPDGGLVADVAFAGANQQQDAVRVGIRSDGALLYDPKTPLSQEALRVLPYLARGLLANQQIAPGQEWTVQAPEPAIGQTTYRVLSVDAHNDAVIALESTLTVKGGLAFSERAAGKTTYAMDLSSPLDLDLTAHIQRAVSADETEATDAHITATLVSDSFKKS